ncbi:MAG: CsbD family protein [Erythrobacter sp.]|uniref:CsbD family protein n=1 Tax=Erythrobacter sp. TaxID=1042 RepID=UPI0025FA73F5|nr:CsbD family protein [Erythrobacter sp.]MCL9998512.1 CsbD family protein [Erythrobacter sp.]
MGEFTDKAKGAVKETIGEAKQRSSDPETRNEGRKQELEGKGDRLKGEVKGVVNRA